jgi:5'-phosphate synthase pdxT subunit
MHQVGAGVEVLGRVAASAKSVLSSTLSGSVVRPSAESQSAADLQQGGAGSVVVAVRQGSILATAFHPELTDDLRWHR